MTIAVPLSRIAMFPLNVVLFPDGPLPLRIFETRYLDMVKRCMRESAGFGAVLLSKGGEVGPAETVQVGTLAKIVDFHQLSDGFLGLSCTGGQRFRIHARSVQPDGLNVGEVEWLPAEAKVAVPPRHSGLSDLLRDVIPQLGGVYESIEMRLDEAAWVGHRLAEILPIPLAEKQFCLELADPIERLDYLEPKALAQ